MKEKPQGQIDGINRDYILSYYPVSVASLDVYKNGLLQDGDGNDYFYDFANKTIRFVEEATPLDGDSIIVSYQP